MRVHAYCWMTNHVHLLMQVSEVPLGRAMLRIAGRYARQVQRRRRTTGHLFEKRYRAILIDADCYLLELIRYIHLNPLRARMVADPARYPWSGHRAYLGLASTPWLTTDVALRLFGNEMGAAREAYRRFVLQGINRSPDRDVLTARRDEPRILGDDRFLAGLKLSWRPRDRRGVDELMDQICARYAVDPTELARSGRRRQPALIRALIAHHALERRIASLSELAQRFNRSASTLCETLEHYRRASPAVFSAPLDLE
jgi:hypothetical protein